MKVSKVGQIRLSNARVPEVVTLALTAPGRRYFCTMIEADNRTAPSFYE